MLQLEVLHIEPAEHGPQDVGEHRLTDPAQPQTCQRDAQLTRAQIRIQIPR